MSLMKKLNELKQHEYNDSLITLLYALIEETKSSKEKDVFLHSKFFLAIVMIDLNYYNEAIIHLQNVYYSSDSYIIPNIQESCLDKLIVCYKFLGLTTDQYKTVKEKESLMHSLGKDSFILNKDLALVYLDLKKYTISEEYFKKSLEFDISDLNKSIVYYKLTQLYIETNQLKEAEKSLKNSNDHAQKCESFYGITINKHLEAKMLIKKEKYEDACIVLEVLQEDFIKYKLKQTVMPIVTYLNLLTLLNDDAKLKSSVQRYTKLFENDKNIDIKQNFFSLCIRVYNDDLEKKSYYVDKLAYLFDEYKMITRNLEQNLITKIDDYSLSKKNEKQMNSLIQLVEKMVRFNTKMNKELEFRDSFMQMINYSKSFLLFDEVSIITLNAFDENVIMKHYKKGLVYDREYKYNQLKDTIFERVLNDQNEIILSSYLELIDIKELFSKRFLDDHNFNSLASFPLLEDGKIHSVIVFYSNSKLFTLNSSTISILKILSELFNSELQISNNMAEDRNIKNIYELSLANKDEGILYTHNFYEYVILHPFEGINKSSNETFFHSELLEYVSEESMKLLNSSIDSIKDSKTDVYNKELDLSFLNGTIKRVNLNAQLKNGILNSASLKMRDVTTEKNSLDEMKTLAYFDSKTGIRNSKSMSEDLEELTNSDRTFSLLVIDLNGLKLINDKYGHTIGDDAIKFIGKSLKDTFDSASDDYTAYRTGGDEFTVLMRDCTSKREINKLIRNYQNELKHNFYFGMGTNLELGSSIGIVRYPSDTVNKKDIWNLADYAMYVIKKQKSKEKFFKYYEKKDYITFQKLNVPKEISLFDIDDFQ